MPGKAFCHDHCALLVQLMPKVSSLFKPAHDHIITLYSYFLGIDSLISSHPDIAVDANVDDEDRLCRKDTGLGVQLRKWSRGHQFVVRGGGHIYTWQPLYK